MRGATVVVISLAPVRVIGCVLEAPLQTVNLKAQSKYMVE